MKQEKANLARIRDNQRRSRARRKEYLQELESRLRQCELQGIEASSEIQMAARRVADENKKLRGLLAQHGVADDTIEGYLQSSPTSDMMGNQFGSSSGAVQILEQLLQTRKACCADGNTGAPSNSGMGGSGSRDSSVSVSTIQSIWDSTNPHRRSGVSQSTNSTSQQFMTPRGTPSSTTSLGQSSSHSIQRQRLATVGLSRGASPGSNRRSQMFDFDTQLAMPQSSYHQPQQYSQPQTSSSLYMPITTTSSSNVNSCEFAADMITTMSGATDPNAVRADLGCLPGMDCEVDNHQIFSVMDRYSGTSVGL